MTKGARPSCIGAYGFEDDCYDCEWQQECKNYDKTIEASATRAGTHIRLTGKYKEKKFKPKTSR